MDIMDKTGSHLGQEVIKGRQKDKVQALPVRSPFKPVWLQLLEIIRCAEQYQQQTGVSSKLCYLGVKE